MSGLWMSNIQGESVAIICWWERNLTTACNLQYWSAPSYPIRSFSFMISLGPFCHAGCKFRELGASCRPVSPGEETPISASSVTQLSKRLPRHVLAKFHFHQYIVAISWGLLWLNHCVWDNFRFSPENGIPRNWVSVPENLLAGIFRCFLFRSFAYILAARSADIVPDRGCSASAVRLISF